MMIIRNQTSSCVTVVTNRFIDEYMAEANGEFVKVYLYLLRLAQSAAAEIRIMDIADRLNDTEADVRRALRYWEKQKLLSLIEGADGEILELSLTDQETTCQGLGRRMTAESPAPVRETEKAEEKKPEAAKKPEKPVVKALSPESMERLQATEDFSNIVLVAETYLGRALTPKDIQLFAYLYEELQFPEDLIEYLVGYCVEGGHRSNRYIETVALGWHQDGLITVEKAKAATMSYSKENRQVMKAFGIAGRILTDEERGYVDKWLNTFKLPLKVVVEGCHATMAAIQKPSFQYTDRILSDWQAAGIRTVEAAKAYRESRKAGAAAGKSKSETVKKETGNRFQNYQQRNIDYDALLNQDGINPYGKKD